MSLKCTYRKFNLNHPGVNKLMSGYSNNTRFLRLYLSSETQKPPWLVLGESLHKHSCILWFQLPRPYIQTYRVNSNHIWLLAAPVSIQTLVYKRSRLYIEMKRFVLREEIFNYSMIIGNKCCNMHFVDYKSDIKFCGLMTPYAVA